MSALSFVQSLVGGIGDFYAWVADRLNDDAAREEVLRDLALPPTLAVGQALPQHQLKGINEYRKTISIETEVATAAAQDLGKALGLSSSKAAKLALPAKSLSNIRRFRDKADPSLDDFKKSLGDVKDLFTALSNFVKALDVEGIHNLSDLTHRLLDLLLVDYLRLHHPFYYWLAQPIGFLEEPVTQVDLPRLVWPRLVSFFKRRGWVLDDEAQAREFSDRFFLPIASALVVLGFKSLNKSVTRADDGDLSTVSIEPFYGWEPAPGSNTPRVDAVSERTLSVRLSWLEENPTPPRKVVEKHTTATLLFVPRTDGGPGLLISFEGGASFDVPVTKNSRVKLEAALTGVADFFIHLNSFTKSRVIGPAEGSRPSVKVTFEGGSADEPLYRLGKEDGSHVQLGKAAIELELSPDLAGFRVLSRESDLVLNLGQSSNGFLSRILPGEQKLPLNLGLGWSTERGFFIEGGKGNVLKQTTTSPPSPAPQPRALRAVRDSAPAAQPDADLQRITPVGRTLGPVRVQSLSVTLSPQSENGKAKVVLAAGLALDVKIGPLTASMDGLGFGVSADFAKPDANLSFFDLDFGFQPPTAIGLDIDAKVVHGGGFLDLDAAHNQYAGVIHLEIEGIAAVTALGLLNTSIPGGGFSLLVIITADGFKPIPIGFGFMLSRIGGLVGIHRTANETALQTGVRNNTLEAVLAPRDLIRNAPQYLSTLGSFFPVARDHFLFGPVVQITWGSPPLLTINLALVFEFGVRTRFLVMGQVLAVLPKKELDLVRLQMNVFGGVDFDQKRAFLDAALFDSRLLDRFVMTGEMRMRLSWGDQPFFALAIGGLHPAFTPPPGLERMQRVAIIFADSDDLKIRCDGYFAITSNTVQFGANAVLFAKKSKFSITGQAGFDVLIQFDPFQFIAALHASLQLKAGSTNLFKVAFRGELSGPRPLHVQGKATFEIFWVDYSVSFNRTLVPGERPPLPAAVDVGELLRIALADSASWNAAVPGTGERLVSLREGPTNAPHVHPLATLTVKQSVVPLNMTITRFGNARPAGGPQEFRVQKIKIGEALFDPTVVRDHFAPAQFRDMADDEKLSSPSFELLPAGVRVTANGADCGTPVPASADFEDIVIPSPPDTPRVTSTLAFTVAASFAQWSAAGLSAAARLGASRYQAPAIPSVAQVRTYTVASRVDLSTVTASFTTRIEAADALSRIRRPGESLEFQVVSAKS